MKLLTAGVVALLLASVTPTLVFEPTSCDKLASLKLPYTTITGSEVVPAGGFPQPSGGAQESFKRLPPFCRVSATIKPSSDSDIRMEVWMPLSGWNGNFQAVGNGGWGGAIGYPAMARAVADGYATTSTDTGHVGASASFALGHPEKLIDYAYRSEHEMTVKAKAVIDAFYAAAPKFSYFNGCSTGGRQALVEAARYPDDFDGIVAGAAANPKTGLDSWRIWMAQAMFKDSAATIPVGKFSTIHRAVLEACDAIDGLKDGQITDPTKCRFNPEVVQCRGADGPDCLTEAQVKTARVIMSAPRDRSGAELFPGFELGTELGWERMLAGPDAYETAVDQFRYIVFDDPNWNWRTFNLERDLALAKKKSAGTLSSIDPDLSAFARHGGKLLMYHGWSDQDIAPRASVNFYTKSLAATKSPAKNTEWLRLFMVPGMGHCGGGEGPNSFDMMKSLVPWREKDTLPTRIVASRLTERKVTRTRPLCPYPQAARFKGTGSIDDESSFVCAVP